MVETSRADSLVRSGRVPAPSLIKIDVEGGEVCVLRGCDELLATARPLMAIEVHNTAAMFRTQEILAARGYRLTLLGPTDQSSSRCHVLGRPPGGG